MNQQYSKNLSDGQSAAASIETGFTMVEVVVALVILSTTVIAVFGAMTACLSGAHHTRRLTGSVLLAETKLVETRLRLSENATFETTQGHEDLYRWEVRVAPSPVENLAAIRVQVKWLEQQRQQQYELFSLFYIEPAIKG
jgi:Tfp pilus assembly protein PilV